MLCNFLVSIASAITVVCYLFELSAPGLLDVMRKINGNINKSVWWYHNGMWNLQPIYMAFEVCTYHSMIYMAGLPSFFPEYLLVISKISAKASCNCNSASG